MTKPPERADPLLDEEMALVELVSRVLDRGVVLVGDVMITVAGVDLVQLGLSLYVSSVETAEARRREAAETRPDGPGPVP